jgi:hypothetical protein
MCCALAPAVSFSGLVEFFRSLSSGAVQADKNAGFNIL